MFFIILFLAHLQSVILPIYLALKSFQNFKHLPNFIFIPLGFLSIAFASIFEIIDHTNTNWIYINHSTKWNWLFYSFLSLGLILFSIAITKKRTLIYMNIMLFFCTLFSYWIFGKSMALTFQALISFYLIINWGMRFKDWLIFAYPIFGILLTTIFGRNLILTNNQIWHLFIGPSGSLSVLTFYLVLKRAKG